MKIILINLHRARITIDLSESIYRALEASHKNREILLIVHSRNNTRDTLITRILPPRSARIDCIFEGARAGGRGQETTIDFPFRIRSAIAAICSAALISNLPYRDPARDSDNARRASHLGAKRRGAIDYIARIMPYV